MKQSRHANLIRKVIAWLVIIAMVLFAAGGTLAVLLEARRFGG